MKRKRIKKMKRRKKKMKNESIQVVKSVFENPLSILKLGTTQDYENMTVIPIIV